MLAHYWLAVAVLALLYNYSTDVLVSRLLIEFEPKMHGVVVVTGASRYG